MSIITAATVATLGSLSVQANDEQTVQVASLQVKERLRSIEQINVSAETTPTEEKPISDAVAKLLEEAETLDAE
ncbi:MAG: hypothetical protein AAF541_18325 [Pseudomonadota bacterium]